ncbi:MAG TPA: Gfo/Idh/MocA family oxidoreductase [Thermomicrobiales bacterium]|jgi:predicted dehydrogenase
MPLRIVHVGLGGWGRDWATNVVPNVKAVEPVAWVDADTTTLAAARKTLTLPVDRCYPTLAAAIEAVPADAVLITTPIGAHVPVALEALAAGKHVLVEKPFAPSVDEARKAVETAEARGLVLMVSQNYRFFPAPRTVADLIAGGELGAVGAIAVDFRRNVTSLPGRERHFALAHPLLVDMAIHHFDLMRLILGREAKSASCQTWNPPWSPFAGDAAGAATIAFDGGAVASWRGSWVSPGEQTAWAGEWRVECAGGEIRWTSRGELGGPSADCVEVRSLDAPARALTLKPVRAQGRAGTLTAFAAAVGSDQEPETSGRDNLKTLALVAAVVASAATGRTVLLSAEAEKDVQ